MTNEFEARKARLMDIINRLEEGDKYVITVLHPLDDSKTAGTVAINGSKKDVFTSIGEIVKNILKADNADAMQCLALSRELGRFITEACAEASAEMLHDKDPREAIRELSELLELLHTEPETDAEAEADNGDE